MWKFIRYLTTTTMFDCTIYKILKPTREKVLTEVRLIKLSLSNNILRSSQQVMRGKAMKRVKT